MNQKTFDTTKWYRTDWGVEYLPVVVYPDADGFVPVMSRSGDYNLMRFDHLIPIPERHIVELRKPKKRERFISSEGLIIIAPKDYVIHEQWVIVEESST